MPPPENRLLSALPTREFDRLTARMTDVTLGHKDLVYRAGGPIDHVYFPRTGVVSAVAVMDDGATAEVAAIGREGMTGASAALGATTCPEQVFCQVPPAECRRMPAAEFAAEVNGYTATKHQREVGTGYFDAVSMAITGGQSSTTAMHESTEHEQFKPAAE